jgi:hypothetical protein
MVAAIAKALAGEKPKLTLAATTGADGAYELPNVPPGEYGIAALRQSMGQTAGSAPAQAMVRSGERAQVDITIPAGEVTVVVRKAGAAPTAPTRVMLRGSTVHYGVMRDEQGARFAGVEPGKYQLCVLPSDGSAASGACVAAMVNAAPLVQELALTP